jgi:hypothetical protein
MAVTATKASRPTRSPRSSSAAAAAAALSGDPSIPTSTSTGPLPGSPPASSRDQEGRPFLIDDSANSSAIGPSTRPSTPQVKEL